MPIFEYQCAACGERFERLLFGNERPDLRCPRCGKSGAVRVMSTFAVATTPDASPPGPCGSPDCACRRQ